MSKLTVAVAALLNTGDQTGCTPDLIVVSAAEFKTVQQALKEEAGVDAGPAIEEGEDDDTRPGQDEPHAADCAIRLHPAAECTCGKADRASAEQDAQELIALAEQLHRDPEILDELVHENAQEGGLDDLNAIEDEGEQEEHIGGVEEDASSINNGGFASQIPFLLKSGVSREQIEGILRTGGNGGIIGDPMGQTTHEPAPPFPGEVRGTGNRGEFTGKEEGGADDLDR